MRRANRRRRVRPLFELLEERRVPAIFTVNILADDNDGLADGQISLREAIGAANSAPGADVIDFSVVGAIDLNPGLPALSINGALTIDGPGPASLSVQYANPATAKRLLEVVANSDVTIDGLTFRNGKGQTGGAISAVNARLRVTDCVFENNVAIDDGGAVYFAGRSSNGHTLTLIDSIFANNSTADGGAVWAQPFPNSDVGGPVQVEIDNCQFVNNHAHTTGALLVSGDHNSSLVVTDSTFANNIALNNGGAVAGGFGNNSILTIGNCDFTNNSAGGGGGSVLHTLGTGSQMAITDSSFTNNHAGGNGGNVLVTVRGPITIERSTFIGNQASNPIGGVGIGGALWTQGVGGSTTIRDSYFADNFANQGGAIQTTHPGLIERTTFVNNYAKTLGGAVNAASGGMTFINDTFSGNRSDGNGGALIGSGLTINHSTFTGNRADANGDGVGIGGGITLGSSVVMHNTIVAGNFRGSGVVMEDLFGGLVAGSSNNLISVNTGIASGGANLPNGVNGNMVGTAANPINPLLAALANNGGFAPTHALLDASPVGSPGTELEFAL